MHRSDPRRGLALVALTLQLGFGAATTAGEAWADAQDQTELKRITVLETNNFRLARGFRGLALPDLTSDPQLAALRDYLRPRLAPKAYEEFELMRALTALVHGTLSHHPFGDATPGMGALEILQGGAAGKRFSCVEYALTLAELLNAQGLPARSTSLQSSDIAYGELASGHVLTEVWSNQYDKWLLLDAQWGVYAERAGTPLNAYELHAAKVAGRWDEIRFRAAGVEPPAPDAERLDREYRAFITPYLGHLSARLLADDEGVPVLLRMEGSDWPLTFQGLPRKAHVFASGPEDLYFGLNHTSLVMEFRQASQPLSQTTVEFGSEEEYRRKMAQFAAVPDFDVTAHHNMPWFDHFEYALDEGPWRGLAEDSLRWQLHEGDNLLRVRAVNAAGRAGPVTYSHIRYGP